MLSKYNYHCRHCEHKLTFSENVSFIIENDSGKRGLLSIKAGPGVYSYTHDLGATLTHGQKLKFFCPGCKEDLQSQNFPKYVELNLFVTDDIVFEVLFSPICGERLTYVVMQGELEKYEDIFLYLDPDFNGKQAS